MPKLSIVICTRDRRASLLATLASVAADTSVVSREVLVVDNGSTDGTSEALAKLGDITTLREPVAGQSRARNLGVRHATGEIVLFTDDDVTVRDGWADAMVAPFADPGVGAVGGRVLARFDGPVPSWMHGPHLNQFALVDYGEADRTLTGYEMPFGANMAIRRDVLGVDPFNVRLGHTGDAAMGWEEWHLLLTLPESVRIVYAANAVVDHHVPVDRLRWESVRRALFLSGMGRGRHRRLSGEPSPDVARRVIRTVRAWRGVRAARRRNAARSAPTGVEAWEEFGAYVALGELLDDLSNSPAVSDLIARRALRS